jgi:hypothetical protein
MSYDETQKRISLDADASIGFRTGPPGMPGSLDPNGGMQFHFVDILGTHICGLAGAGGDAVGVLQNKPQHVGDASSVAIFGVSMVVAGVGGLAAGNAVSSDATGQGILTTSTNKVLGKCIEAAGVGELAAVLLRMN